VHAHLSEDESFEERVDNSGLGEVVIFCAEVWPDSFRFGRKLFCEREGFRSLIFFVRPLCEPVVEGRNRSDDWKKDSDFYLALSIGDNFCN